MKKIIPLSFVVGDLDEILVKHKVSNVGDIKSAVNVMMDAAIRNYFLSIPNPNEVDYLESAIDAIEPRMELTYDDKWYSLIFEHCEGILEHYFKRWDDVTYTIRDQVLFIQSHGDFRIKYYHEQFGIGRIGSDRGKPLESVAEINDPFFVADNIDATIDRDAYNATKYDLSAQLADTPDYLIIRGTDDRSDRHRRRV